MTHNTIVCTSLYYKLYSCCIQVYSHRLNLPHGVDVLHATASAGHLSSSTIYPACLAPYLFATACTDGLTRFWTCRQQGQSFTWSEWKMPGPNGSSLMVPGTLFYYHLNL